MEFYTTAAQVLPVILAVLLLEVRFLHMPTDAGLWWVRLQRRVVVCVIAAGEVAAFAAIDRKHAGAVEHTLVVLALLTSGFAVFWGLWNPWGDRGRTRI